MPTSLERIRVPTIFIVLLAYGIFLFAPLCPVNVKKSEWQIPCAPPDACEKRSEFTEVQPPLLVLSSGLSWEASSVTPSDVGANYTYSANPWLAAAFLLLPVLVMLPLVFLKKHPSAKRKAGTWRHVVLHRQTWRTCLWLIGLSFLLLSAFWAWSCLIFYGAMVSAATIDPLLTSTIGTFLMSGLGFATMMLAVRSRAIWPVRSEDVEE